MNRMFSALMSLALTAFFVAGCAVAGDGDKFFREITDDLAVERGSSEQSFMLVDSRRRKLIVEDVGGWIINARYVMGSNGDKSYYYYDRACGTIQTFRGIKDFVRALEVHRIGTYSYANEEGPADLMYSGEKSRFADVSMTTDCESTLESESGSQGNGVG